MDSGFTLLYLGFQHRSGAGNGISKGFYFRLGVAYSPVLNAPGISALADPLVALPQHNVSIPLEFQWQMKSRFGLVFQYRPVNIDANIRSAVARESSPVSK